MEEGKEKTKYITPTIVDLRRGMHLDWEINSPFLGASSCPSSCASPSRRRHHDAKSDISYEFFVSRNVKMYRPTCLGAEGAGGAELTAPTRERMVLLQYEFFKSVPMSS